MTAKLNYQNEVEAKKVVNMFELLIKHDSNLEENLSITLITKYISWEKFENK